MSSLYGMCCIDTLHYHILYFNIKGAQLNEDYQSL